MKISVKPNRKKQIYCYFFTLPPNTPFHILEKHTLEQRLKSGALKLIVYTYLTSMPNGMSQKLVVN